jgi:SAM-dependent methyltransferase
MDLGRTFDCIVAGEVIEHLSNPGAFLDKMALHLKPDGHLIITTPNAFNIRLFWRILKNNNIKAHGEHTCWYDPLTLTQLLMRHSFGVERIFFSNRKKWYLRKNIFKLKYQMPKLITFARPYFSGTIVAIAKKRAAST